MATASAAETKASLYLANLLVKQEEEKEAAMAAFKTAKRDLETRNEVANRMKGIEVGLNCRIVATDAAVIKQQAYLNDLQNLLNRKS